MKHVSTFVLTLILILTCAPLLSSSASAQEYWCGKQCNGKPPHWVIPSNGIMCDKSANVVKKGVYTTDGGAYFGVDTQMHYKVYYSTVCQTLWFSVTNKHPRSAVMKECTLEIYNDQWKGGIGGHSGMYRPACPKPGHTVTSKMVNDHSPKHKVFAQGGGYERVSSKYYKKFTSGFSFKY